MNIPYPSPGKQKRCSPLEEHLCRICPNYDTVYCTVLTVWVLLNSGKAGYLYHVGVSGDSSVLVGTGVTHLSLFSQWKQRQLGHKKGSKMEAMAGVTGTLQSLFQQAKMHSAVLSSSGLPQNSCLILLLFPF